MSVSGADTSWNRGTSNLLPRRQPYQAGGESSEPTAFWLFLKSRIPAVSAGEGIHACFQNVALQPLAAIAIPHSAPLTRSGQGIRESRERAAAHPGLV